MNKHSVLEEINSYTNNIDTIKFLTGYLNENSNKYYNSGTSELTDKDYDELLLELEALENMADFRLQDSPTHKVGYTVLDSLPKSKHPAPLLSADKTKSLEDLVNFAKKGKCLASVKCDGLTTNIYTENGKVIKGVTRGDGEIGQDVSHNIAFVSNLPNKIQEKQALRITGESVIFNSDFEKMKKTVKTSTGEQFSNSRNMASGSLTLGDSKKFAQRKVKFVAFNVEKGFEDIDSLEECYKRLTDLGFTVVPYTVVPKNATVETMKEITEAIKDCAEQLGLPYDGVILRYDSRSFGKSLGRTEKFYRDLIAYKFENDWYDTKLKTIEWNTSRIGAVVPTAIFDEVDINGVKINRATLNNLSFVNNLALHKGDRIAISRRNEVIPYVEKNYIEHKKTEDELIPTHCPCCNTLLIQTTNGMLVCPNTNNCTAQTVGKINHFASKEAMNIEGLSIATIDLLVSKGWLTEPIDLYRLSKYKDFLVKLEGFGIKSYENLINSIEKSRHTTLNRLIIGLGIPNVGKSLAKTIALHYDYDFNKFYQEGIKQSIDYNTLKDCGEKTSLIIKSFFKQEKVDQKLLKLSQELIFEKPEIIKADLTSPFLNKQFCITGTFKCGKRSDLQKAIENMGCTFVSGVSKNTNILIAGEKCGSKLDKAKQLGIQIMNEEELQNVLKVGENNE